MLHHHCCSKKRFSPVQKKLSWFPIPGGGIDTLLLIRGGDKILLFPTGLQDAFFLQKTSSSWLSQPLPVPWHAPGLSWFPIPGGGIDTLLLIPGGGIRYWCSQLAFRTRSFCKRPAQAGSPSRSPCPGFEATRRSKLGPKNTIFETICPPPWLFMGGL